MINKKKMIKIALAIKRENKINSLRLQKKLKNNFLSLLDDINIKKSSSNININLTKFKNNISKTLITNWKYFFNKNKNLKLNLWGKKEDDFNIPAIKKKLEKKYISLLATKITNITNRVENTLKKVVSDNKSLPYNELSKKIRETVVDISEKRSRVIALTETQTINNQIDNDMAIECEMEYKIWIHSGGGKFDRPEHAALDYTKIKTSEYFNVGGTLALCPCDSSLGPEDVVNCHCLCVYE